MKPLTRPGRHALGCATLIIGALGACRSRSDGSSSANADPKASAQEATADSESLAAAQDPCTLLSASEAQRFVGDLETPPYRYDGTRASTTGNACIYRGRDGREIQINPSASGGADVGSALEDIPNKMGAALEKRGATGLDSMGHRVIQKMSDGPWDKASWIPGGSLFVTKGDAMVQVDVSGSSGKKEDAIAIATLAMPRLGNPLDYDGAKAVAAAPKPRAHPANACDFMTREEVESAIGKLSGDPMAGPDGSACTYTVETAHGTQTYPVNYEWEGGAKNYTMQKNSAATMSSAFGMPSTGKLDSMKLSGKQGEMIGALMKVASGGSMTTAPGAASTEGFRTDTTLAGPWDHAMLQHGTQLMAVRHDTFVLIMLTSADYPHAKALLAAIHANSRSDRDDDGTDAPQCERQQGEKVALVPVVVLGGRRIRSRLAAASLPGKIIIRRERCR